MAATNKYLARSNKSPHQGQATKKRRSPTGSVVSGAWAGGRDLPTRAIVPGNKKDFDHSGVDMIWIILALGSFGLMCSPWWVHKKVRILAYVMLFMAASLAYNAHFVSHKPLFSDTRTSK
jgi:hypothetical protein